MLLLSNAFPRDRRLILPATESLIRIPIMRPSRRAAVAVAAIPWLDYCGSHVHESDATTSAKAMMV